MENLSRILLTILICLVALGQFVQVITRYILEIPVMGLEELMAYPTMWLYIMAAVNASRENTQIRANVLEIFLKTPRAHTILAIIGEVVSLIVGSWLIYWAWRFTKYSWKIGKESPTLYIPTFFADVALFVGLVLMMVWTFIHLVTHIRALGNPVLMQLEEENNPHQDIL
ncbi:MAG: TRAP transporter small permease subunit [Alphaproteobacteria bacterium]|nr:TRAP transporter small permease subunit [Alphaproteobacteria bacterium]